jgi:hypothetical protein
LSFKTKAKAKYLTYKAKHKAKYLKTVLKHQTKPRPSTNITASLFAMWCYIQWLLVLERVARPNSVLTEVVVA